MTKIDIVSGFLGAGKTTLIKKLLADAFNGEKLVLIENEFGEIGIDGGFLKDSGVQVTEMNSGCICCSLVGDFRTSLKEVIDKYSPDRIIIEPSGVGKLSDVIKAVNNIVEETGDQISLNSTTAVVDGIKTRMYMKNFGEFFNNQVESAGTIVISRTQILKEDKLEGVVELLKEHNGNAKIITTPWDEIDGSVILKAMEQSGSLVYVLNAAITMTMIMIIIMNTNAITMIMTIMTTNVDAMIMSIIITIMQMMYLQAGVLRHLENIQKMRLRMPLTNLLIQMSTAQF